MRSEKLLQCIYWGGNSFSLRYFCILILFVRAWSSSLLLEIPGRSPKSPKYLLDQHSSYPRRITSSDYTLPPFPYVIPHSGTYLIVYSSSDVSTLSNRAQGPVYKFGPSSPHYQLSQNFNAINQLTYSWIHNENNKFQTINHTHKNSGSVFMERKP